jgi:hypothetical protein
MNKDDTKSLQSFLKKYSTVPNTFIDDMFSMVGKSTAQTDKVVDLDKAAKWLGTTKGKLLTTLKRSYVEDADYIVGSGARKILSNDCEHTAPADLRMSM